MGAFGTQLNIGDRKKREREKENAKERAGNIKYKERQKYDNSCALVNAANWGLQEEKKLQKIR